MNNSQIEQTLEQSYQEVLICVALKKALDGGQNNLYDPQGRLLIEVNEEDLKTYYRSEIKQDFTSLKKTATTWCSIDVLALPRDFKKLQEEYKSQYFSAQTASTENSSHSRRTELFEQLENGDRLSLIPIYEEMWMHSRLLLRALISMRAQPSETAMSSDELSKFHDLDKKINEIVRQKFSEGLNTLDGAPKNADKIAVMNELLDEKRAELKIAVQQAVIQSYLQFCGEDRPNIPKIQPALLKKKLLSQVATDSDYLHTDPVNGIVTRITGTTHTAHHKTQGDALANRLIFRNGYRASSENIQVLPSKEEYVNIRVPSIAAEGQRHEIINDIATQKLPALVALFNNLDEASKKNTGPITYYLLTSLYSKPWELIFDRKNYQTQSTDLIFQGIHQYNATQLKASAKEDWEKNLVLIQNIPVNRHTQRLGFSGFFDIFKSKTTLEATLLSELALVSIFRSQVLLTEDLKASAAEILNRYHNYLLIPKSDRKPLFIDTYKGRATIDLIKNFKKKSKNTNLNIGSQPSFRKKVAQALYKIYLNDYHFEKDFGNLTQALSIFLAGRSIAGCKSANERNEDVLRRVEYLSGLELKDSAENNVERNDKEKKFLDALDSLVNAKSLKKAQIESLRSTLAESVNKQALYGAVTTISRNDQGGSSKLKSLSSVGWKFWKRANTNVALDKELTRVQAKYVTLFQAHKIKVDKLISAISEQLDKAVFKITQSFSKIHQRLSRSVESPSKQPENPDLGKGNRADSPSPSHSPAKKASFVEERKRENKDSLKAQYTGM